MKVAVYCRRRLPFSIHKYLENVICQLESMGVGIIRFTKENSPQEGADLYWDPRAAGGASPIDSLINRPEPLAVTLHGARPLVLPAKEVWVDLKHTVKGKAKILRERVKWSRIKKDNVTYIAVSESTKRDFVQELKIPESKITVIYHGVDHCKYQPKRVNNNDSPFLLHASQYQPVKNLGRIVKAYAKSPAKQKVRFVVVSPGFKPPDGLQNLEVRNKPITDGELINLYQNAIGFVFCSLHEGFGLPILEAMACGCPVITSNVTACPEIAGDAALLVNPRSMQEIAQAMSDIIIDPNLRESLYQKGLQRANEFTWRRSAERHLKLFSKAIGQNK